MEIDNQILATGFPIIELNPLKKRGRCLNIIPTLLKLIRKESIGLIHSHLHRANMYGRILAKITGIPVIASIHNTYPTQKWIRRLINWYLARYTTKITVGSKDVQHDVIQYDGVSESLIEIVPNSVDLSRSNSVLTKQQARERLGLADDLLVLGTVGRLVKQKGHCYLIDALRHLDYNGIKPHLLLIGGGREELTLKRQVAKNGLQGQVHFLGTRNDLGDLFRAMDIFVMPSLWEGLSLAMLSAMAAKLPIVATSVGGVHEVLGNDKYGLVVPPASIELLADAIKLYASNKDLSCRIAERGSQRVREYYSDETMVARFQEIYEEALSA
jgi:glycosyltransferase involved in cell wall biosynthesis